MPAKEPAQVSAPERVQNAYKQLNAAAAELNGASDGLKEAMSVLDAALKRLNLGVAAWVKISGAEDEDHEWWSRNIGYAKIGKEWTIALSACSGNYQWPERDSDEEWAFNDAPRWMRLEAIAKVPELLEALIKQATDTTEKLRKRTEQVLELGAAMSKALDEIKGEQNGGKHA